MPLLPSIQDHTLYVRDVVELLNVDATTVRRWVADGKLPAVRVGNVLRFRAVDVDALVKR